MSDTHTITLHHNGVQFDIHTGETILEAAIRNGIELPYGCRAGVCGVCISKILSGRIEYPEGDPLSLFEEDIAANRGLCCVGHVYEDLTLEVINLGQAFEPWDSE